jgi:hypothetical protein
VTLLAQVTAPNFCTGIVLTGDVVTEASPILRYMAPDAKTGRPGWTRDQVRDYVSRKGWKVQVVKL